MNIQQDCQHVDFDEILNCAHIKIYSLTTQKRESLGSFLNTNHKIYVLDTDLLILYVWDGSNWVPALENNVPNFVNGIFTGVTNDIGELVVPHTLGTDNFSVSVLQENSWYPISVTTKTATNFTLVVYDTAYSFPQLFTPITLSWTATAIVS